MTRLAKTTLHNSAVGIGEEKKHADSEETAKMARADSDLGTDLSVSYKGLLQGIT